MAEDRIYYAGSEEEVETDLFTSEEELLDSTELEPGDEVRVYKLEKIMTVQPLKLVDKEKLYRTRRLHQKFTCTFFNGSPECVSRLLQSTER